MQVVEFLELVRKSIDFDIKEITLISAVPIDTGIVQTIQEIFGETTRIHNTIDPRIVDGVEVKIGDMVATSTAQSDLSALLKGNKNEDVVESLKQQIMGLSSSVNMQEQGTVMSVKDGIAEIAGLSHVRLGELVDIKGVMALALNLSQDSVGAVLLSNSRSIQQGDIAIATGKLSSIPVGKGILGTTVNALGTVLDGPVFEIEDHKPIDIVAPGILERSPVNRPLQTGIKAVDALTPIGRGQRQLILGDRQTGKSSITIDTIINQKDTGVICVYVAIGQKNFKIAQVAETLRAAGAMEYTVIIAASASDAPGLLYLAPFAGVSIAEYFASLGKDVLIIYDDLTKHAIAYRELSLLLKRPPGREAYPGDVFYLHSRLLERACQLSPELGGGSITALPIVETQAGDISAYIPTNVISITDGQLFLESDLFYKGQRPAINVGLSVSRVGGSAQTKAVKKVSGSTKLSLAQYREVESFAQFASDLDETTKKQLERGRRTLEIMKQKNNNPLPIWKQILSLYALNNGYLDTIAVENIPISEHSLHEFAGLTNKQLVADLAKGMWDEEIEDTIKSLLKEWKNHHG